MSVVTGNSQVNISVTQTGTLGVSPGTPLPAGLNLKSNFVNASAQDSFAFVHSHTYNFAASTPQTINLQSLLDMLGATFSLTVSRAVRLPHPEPERGVQADGGRCGLGPVERRPGRLLDDAVVSLDRGQ